MSSGAGRARGKGSVGSSASSVDVDSTHYHQYTPPSSSKSNHTTVTTAEVQTVGSLLAAIATCLTESLGILMFADKRHWGPDEFEQTRVLEEALDEAKKDFQEMGPLVHGQFYYETDRTPESLHDLSALHTRFHDHAQSFRDWARQGGPINPLWARETTLLRRELHRAQCRAARRLFSAGHEDGSGTGGVRCLGGLLVHRAQKRGEERDRAEREARSSGPAWQQGQPAGQGGASAVEREERERRGSLEALVPSCNAVGRFQRLAGSPDAAFVCDFCEGYIVWPDLREIPAARAPLAPTAVSGYPHWQAGGVSEETAEPKTVVFAPLAIANHMPPEPGDWQAGLICPFCEEDTYLDEGEDSSELRYVQDERGFTDLEAFRQHLEWYHTALPVPPMSSLVAGLPAAAASNCVVM